MHILLRPGRGRKLRQLLAGKGALAHTSSTMHQLFFSKKNASIIKLFRQDFGVVHLDNANLEKCFVVARPM
jgi:hypothetical protein